MTTGEALGTPISPVDLLPGDEFGNSLGVDGDRLIAGIENGGFGGAAYIYDTDGTLIHKLEPPNDPVTDKPVRGFGRSVAISGNVALVGATPDDTKLGIDEDTGLPLSPTEFSREFGRAYLYDVTTGEMMFELLPDDSTPEDLFSEDLDLSGDVALVAARREAVLGTINRGYLFDVATGEFVSRLNPENDITALDEALEGIAIDGPYAVGGVESYDSPGFSNNGIAIVFDSGADSLDCDLDGNGVCDINDIDLLITEIANNSTTSEFDLNGDGAVDLADRDAWLISAGDENIDAAYLLADANLDGFVDASDFNIWNANKFTNGALWSIGDFNADGSVDVSDFNLWNANKFRASNPISVPEPQSVILLAIGSAIPFLRRGIS